MEQSSCRSPTESFCIRGRGAHHSVIGFLEVVSLTRVGYQNLNQRLASIQARPDREEWSDFREL